MEYSDLLDALNRDKMPVVVVVEGDIYWTIYGVEPWSAMRDGDSPHRGELVVQVVAYTHVEVERDVGRKPE